VLLVEVRFLATKKNQKKKKLVKKYNLSKQVKDKMGRNPTQMKMISDSKWSNAKTIATFLE